MLLRPRQKVFVERCLTALETHDNTLGVAPVAAGKTIMLSGVVGKLLAGNDAKACIIAHREELTQQNSTKFQLVNPDIPVSIVSAQNKSWQGRAVFAMVQTLTKESNLKQIPKLDILVIDEAHHAVASSYSRIIDYVRKINPKTKIYGVTATPVRADKKGLRAVFTNVGDQIRVGELIQSGHLVKPRTFVVDVGTQQELSQVQQKSDDFDMDLVNSIMNKAPINKAIVEHWHEKADNRKTIVFCSTVEHAQSVEQAFEYAGIKSAVIHGDLGLSQRQSVLKRYEQGDTQVICNVAVLTEGYDYPPTGCVILLRPSSHQSTMIQMLGRGLRTVNPELYPGVVKTDCVVLDFGISTLLHGSLEQDIELEESNKQEVFEKRVKDCPECLAEVPANAKTCALCNYEWPGKEADDKENLTDFSMVEIDLLKRSSFLWCDVFDNQKAYIAQGFHAWAGVFNKNGIWYGIGGSKGLTTHLFSMGEKVQCLAAGDDWLNEHETGSSAHKTKRWLREVVTEKQLQYLPPEYRNNYGLTRYRASTMITWQFNQRTIRHLILSHKVQEAA